MKKDATDFLRKLTEAPSPSGFEQPAQRIWRNWIGKYADSVSTDLHGNSIAVLNEKGDLRVMLAAHCDELGFIVNYINDDGYIYFKTIGGFDVGIIPGRRVHIHTRKGPVFGVIGKKAIHIMSDDERKKAPKVENLWIDIGAKNRKEAESLVSVGDPITYTVGYEKLRGNLVISRGFDDKLGSFVIGYTLRLLSGKPLKAALFSVSTVQEEIGLRGAHTSAYGVNPKVGIAVDVTHATDSPNMDKKSLGEVKIGGGPAISRGANINPVVERILIESAEEEGIPYQIEACPRGTGTDANAIQLTRAGVATGLISIPLRYMHTSVELASLKDVENTAKLLTAFIMKIDSSTDFTP